MGKSPSCYSAKDEDGLNRGAWTASEDKILSEYITTRGLSRWRSLPNKTGLKRCGKSCRLRWLNYLRPDIKRGNISPEEEELLIRLHRLLGNRWALIAGRLPGRIDKEIKNYWNSHLSKRNQMGELEPRFQKPFQKSTGMPSYSSGYKEVEDKDHYICQNTPLKTTAVRFSGSVIVDANNRDSYNYDNVLDTLHGINPEAEELRGADNQVSEVEISKSWCELLLEDCMGGYQYNRLEAINGLTANSLISTSDGTDGQHMFPSFSPC